MQVTCSMDKTKCQCVIFFLVEISHRLGITKLQVQTQEELFWFGFHVLTRGRMFQKGSQIRSP